MAAALGTHHQSELCNVSLPDAECLLVLQLADMHACFFLAAGRHWTIYLSTLLHMLPRPPARLMLQLLEGCRSVPIKDKHLILYVP